MQYKIAIIGNEALCTGFELAGVEEAYVVEKQEEAETLIKKLLAREDIGIIGVSSRFIKGIADKELRRMIETSTLPMVVDLPEYGEEAGEDMLRKLIIRAIGIDLER